jgi:single-strand DNA-binding protein
MSAINLNRVCLAGHLTRDPILRKTGGGTPVADLGLAINENYTDKDGKVVQQVCFPDLVAWGKTATAAAEHLRKGDPVLVDGSLVSEQWETQQGEKRNKLRVRVSRVCFLNGKRTAPAGNGAGAPPAPGPSAAPAPADDADPFTAF